MAKEIIKKIVPHLKETGSICWQVGNYIENGSIWPLDLELAHVFHEQNLQLRNRIIWHFGHGLHTNGILAADMKWFFGLQKVITISSILTL